MGQVKTVLGFDMMAQDATDEGCKLEKLSKGYRFTNQAGESVKVGNLSEAKTLIVKAWELNRQAETRTPVIHDPANIRESGESHVVLPLTDGEAESHKGVDSNHVAVDLQPVKKSHDIPRLAFRVSMNTLGKLSRATSDWANRLVSAISQAGQRGLVTLET